MELSFLGRGSAFNTKEGNTSAYFIEDKQLFLIDCGESIFERIMERKLLDQVDTINVLITHTHSDHIGSLGSLIYYSHYMLGKPLNVIVSKKAKNISNIKAIMHGFGCSDTMYNIVFDKSFDNKYETFDSIRYISTDHYSGMDCYGILFYTRGGIVYFSGDTRDVKVIQSIINDNDIIDKLYIDTTTDDYPNNPHLNIDILNKTIPDELKEHVYCMHINNDYCVERAIQYGFNVVKIKKKKTIK